jgi:capsular polysaccharide biosynthesis protein
MENKRVVDDDEIDLVELSKTLVKRKWFIAIFTTAITLFAVVYAYMKTPIYEVKSNIQIGYIGYDKNKEKVLVNNPISIVYLLKIIFNVDDKKVTKKFISEVSNIETNKKVKDVIKVTTSAVSNEEAIKKNNEVIFYLQKRYKPKIEQYKLEQSNKIKDINIKLNKINEFEIPNTKKNIEKLKKQTIYKIDEKIKLLKEQKIKKLQRDIRLLKEINIAKIDEKIKFYKQKYIPMLKQKIYMHNQKLSDYNKAVKELYNLKDKNSNSTIGAITSMQMVNYQNLILNVQNAIENFSIEINKINSESILDLENKKEKILNVQIKNLEEQIENIKNIQIRDLEINKKNIINDKIWEFEHKLKVELPNKKEILKQKIKDLKYILSGINVKNSYKVGELIVNDYPIKPKKKLIVVVAFVTGFILSIFLVFFLEFIQGIKEEDKK